VEAVWVAFFALIGIACTVAGPIILAKMMAKQQAEKEERDYARQDEVAKRVTEAAENLVVQNERVALATEITNTKLDEVHVGTLRRQLDATTEPTRYRCETDDSRPAQRLRAPYPRCSADSCPRTRPRCRPEQRLDFVELARVERCRP